MTTGHADGVVLELDVPDEAVLNFEMPVVHHRFSLRAIAVGPVVVQAGGSDIEGVFEREPLGIG